MLLFVENVLEGFDKDSEPVQLQTFRDYDRTRYSLSLSLSLAACFDFQLDVDLS